MARKSKLTTRMVTLYTQHTLRSPFQCLVLGTRTRVGTRASCDFLRTRQTTRGSFETREKLRVVFLPCHSRVVVVFWSQMAAAASAATKKRKLNESKFPPDDSYVPLTELEMETLIASKPELTVKLKKAGVLYKRASDTSSVWRHFHYCKHEGKAAVICLCCALVTGSYGTSNMRNHLYLMHRMSEFAPKSVVGSGQKTLDSYGSELYRSEREKALVYFLIKDMRPLRTVQTEAFKDLCWELTKHDTMFSVPDPKTVSMRIRAEHVYLQHAVSI